MCVCVYTTGLAACIYACLHVLYMKRDELAERGPWSEKSVRLSQQLPKLTCSDAEAGYITAL